MPRAEHHNGTHRSFSPSNILPAKPVPVPERRSSARPEAPNAPPSPLAHYPVIDNYFADFSSGEGETPGSRAPSPFPVLHTARVAQNGPPAYHNLSQPAVNHSQSPTSRPPAVAGEVYVQHSSNSRPPEMAGDAFDERQSTSEEEVDDQTDDRRQYVAPQVAVQEAERPFDHEDPQASYDLRPPQARTAMHDVEVLSKKLFSTDHLNFILRDPIQHARFGAFVQKYRPQHLPLLAKYLDSQKAVAAFEYANALAGRLMPGVSIANMNQDFNNVTADAVHGLCEDALPGFITYRMVQIVTETLVKEITGQNTPIMRDMVRGLAEVYCLTDPSLQDNPIVYASEEFFRCTQYGKDFVLGRNCRFLQGPNTSGMATQRLIDALDEGQEICETILNYRMDGTPFLNLLLIAPLYDNTGRMRYFIGAQIDITGLIEDGRGLESFQRLLESDRATERLTRGGQLNGTQAKQPSAALDDLALLWSPSEHESILESSRNRTTKSVSQPNMLQAVGGPTLRRYLGLQEPDDYNYSMYPAPQLGHSGRLPGVFQNYLLVRPYPSLRITFTSPALRVPGLLQAKLLDRIAAPPHIRDGIVGALSSGIGVTARVDFLTYATDERGFASPSPHVDTARNSRPRWIHCTPLLGADQRVGVWMVVMVESETITGALRPPSRSKSRSKARHAKHSATSSATLPSVPPTTVPQNFQSHPRPGGNVGAELVDPQESEEVARDPTEPRATAAAVRRGDGADGGPKQSQSQGQGQKLKEGRSPAQHFYNSVLGRDKGGHEAEHGAKAKKGRRWGII